MPSNSCFGPVVAEEELVNAGSIEGDARAIAASYNEWGGPVDFQLRFGPTLCFLPRVEPRFSESALASVSDQSDRMQCECPRHLAELLTALAGFERYSRQCEDDTTEEAELQIPFRLKGGTQALQIKGGQSVIQQFVPDSRFDKGAQCLWINLSQWQTDGQAQRGGILQTQLFQQ